MPHVSSNRLDDEKRKALYREFVKALEKAFDAGKGFGVMQEFLTFTEKVMFAKRLAVIALLKKNISVYKISNVLKMSRVTIDTMSAKYEASKYDLIIRIALKEKGVLDILDDVVENLNTAGGFMPPYIGRRKYKNSN